MNVTIGGDRLGAGNKNKVWMREYERSTHDTSFLWRSTISAGTLVPFMTEIALPGDTLDIDLNCDILSHPTIGPLFGKFKIQLDVFQIPFRLYNSQIHMNALGIGRDMSKIKLPQIQINANGINKSYELDNQQINPSSIFSYLGIRGVGYDSVDPTATVSREFAAVPYLGYWDIYKNYYANKQEEIGAMIHKPVTLGVVTLTQALLQDGTQSIVIPLLPPPAGTYIPVSNHDDWIQVEITGTGITYETMGGEDLRFHIVLPGGGKLAVRGDELWGYWHVENGRMLGSQPTQFGNTLEPYGLEWIENLNVNDPSDTEPLIYKFPLENIDNMRKTILTEPDHVVITAASPAPYGTPLEEPEVNESNYSKQYSQEGLALKTYNSDLFNNWISTEWIDGPDGVSAVTAIDTSGGSFTIDELNLSKKIYDMLNRIALSGGSYDDWIDTVYTHERQRSVESPVYLGGLIKELVFQEVISNSRSLDQPLGTLAGRGTIGHKHKGGKIIVKTDEPSYIMGIISLTPLIDYSQGNKWDTGLKTWNDFHKPALDEIGFQDLITDQMAWFDTAIDNATGEPIFKSAGKQPAWINYMTNVNVVKGNFAVQSSQMFMVLNRRYESNVEGMPMINDLTTYIDPTKFNHIFADTRRDAQNFWAQIAVNIEARRKMSAKVIPNL